MICKHAWGNHSPNIGTEGCKAAALNALAPVKLIYCVAQTQFSALSVDEPQTSNKLNLQGGEFFLRSASEAAEEPVRECRYNRRLARWHNVFCERLNGGVHMRTIHEEPALFNASLYTRAREGEKATTANILHSLRLVRIGALNTRTCL